MGAAATLARVRKRKEKERKEMHDVLRRGKDEHGEVEARGKRHVRRAATMTTMAGETSTATRGRKRRWAGPDFNDSEQGRERAAGKGETDRWV